MATTGPEQWWASLTRLFRQAPTEPTAAMEGRAGEVAEPADIKVTDNHNGSNQAAELKPETSPSQAPENSSQSLISSDLASGVTFAPDRYPGFTQIPRTSQVTLANIGTTTIGVYNPNDFIDRPFSGLLFFNTQPAPDGNSGLTGYVPAKCCFIQ